MTGQPYNEAAFDPRDREFIRLAESAPFTPQPEPYRPRGHRDDEVILDNDDDPGTYQTWTA